MFTGIIKDVAEVSALEGSSRLRRITLKIKSPDIELEAGDSLAVEGVCLTVIKQEKEFVVLSAVEETLNRTTLKHLKENDRVNIEPALKMSDSLDGHYVTGHIDTTEKLLAVKKKSDNIMLEIGLSSDYRQLAAEKGSIAVDGISLTIADIYDDYLTVHIIPYTYEHTTLFRKKSGQPLNIEYDILAKYINAQTTPQKHKSALTEEALREKGFI